MIKECKVVLRYPKVSVVLFDDLQVQVPTSDLVGETAFIKLEDGKYTVVSKDEFQKTTEKKKPTKKKNVEVEIENNTDTVVIDNVDVTSGV